MSLKQMVSKRPALAAAALVFSVAALAKVWGPFYVSAIGPDYATRTSTDDALMSYEAAQKLASIYLSPALNTPLAIIKALKSDYLRVVYYDGQIIDYKIERWPSSMPVGSPKKMSRLDQQHLSPADQEKLALADARCSKGIYTPSFYVETGYWGATSWWDPVAMRGGTTGYWVDTGRVLYFDGKDCGGK